MCAVPAVTPDDTELARRATGGDREAFSLLFDRWLDRSFDVAWHILYNREAAADAAQEAFAAAWGQIGSLRQPESFGGWLLRITRNKALNQLAKQRRSSPVGSEEALVTMDPRQADDPTAQVEESEYGDLVWAASTALGEDDASLLSLHLRHDLGTPELAEELGVKPNAVHQRLFRLKKRLADAIAAWVLWRKGEPSCPDLRALLESAQVTSFDAATSKAITSHAGGCDACVSSRKLRLSPEALFAAMPLVAAGPVLRARMVAALGGQGVPASEASAEAAEPAETTEMDIPGDAASGPGRSDPSQTAELQELNEPGWDEPGDPAAAGDADAPAAPDRSRRWRRTTVGAGAAAVVLLIGLVSLTVLAERSGDGAGANEAAPTTDAGEATTSTASSDSTTTTTTDDPTTTEPQDDPGVPGTVDEPTPGTDASNVTTTSVTTEPPRGEPGAGPEILRFEGRPTGRTCLDPTGGTVQVTFAWETSDATSATLGLEGGQAETVSPASSGTATRCARPGSTWVLTAFGEGDPVSRTATVPGRTTPTIVTIPGDIISP